MSGGQAGGGGRSRAARRRIPPVVMLVALGLRIAGDTGNAATEAISAAGLALLLSP